MRWRNVHELQLGQISNSKIQGSQPVAAVNICSTASGHFSCFDSFSHAFHPSSTQGNTIPHGWRGSMLTLTMLRLPTTNTTGMSSRYYAYEGDRFYVLGEEHTLEANVLTVSTPEQKQNKRVIIHSKQTNANGNKSFILGDILFCDENKFPLFDFEDEKRKLTSLRTPSQLSCRGSVLLQKGLHFMKKLLHVEILKQHLKTLARILKLGCK